MKNAFQAFLAALLFGLKNGSAIQIAVSTYLQFASKTPAEREAAATSAVVLYLQKRGTTVDPALVALIVDFAIHHLPKGKSGK